MKLEVISCPKGFAPIVVLQTLAENASKEKPITCKQIVEILQDEFTIERKSVERIVKQLKYAGVPINGVNEISEDYEEPEKNFRISRSGIYLERDFSDENLQLLIDSVLYSKYISKAEAEELMKKIRDMGSATFQKKNKGIAKLSSVYHARETRFFKELNVIQQAIAQEKKLSFSYGAYKENNGKFVIEERDNKVSPYHLVFSNGKYYLIGYREEKNQIWHYRVDKIYKAKIESGDRKPITDTALKGVSIGDYVLQHPFLFTGTSERIVMKVNSDQIGHVVDTFGENFQRISYDKLTTTIAVNCAEDDAYYWALQFSGIVEVLEPQNLRERLRVAAEELAMRYMNGDGDKYNEALRKSENNGDLDLTGIHVKNRTQHYKLYLKTLTLSDNDVADISFVKNYERLNIIKLFNNPITDLSPLSTCDKTHTLWLKNLAITDLSALVLMKGLRCLDLEQCENVDGSALYQMPNLESLRIRGSVKNLDVEELKKRNPKLDVHITEVRQRTDFIKSICSEYPLNVLKEAFGYNHVFVGDKEEATLAVDKLLLRLSADERDVAELVFKEGFGESEVSDTLAISVEEIGRRMESCKKKFKHKSYNRGLEKYIAVKNPKSTNAMEKLMDMVGIPEEERPANKKH